MLGWRFKHDTGMGLRFVSDLINVQWIIWPKQVNWEPKMRTEDDRDEAQRRRGRAQKEQMRQQGTVIRRASPCVSLIFLFLWNWTKRFEIYRHLNHHSTKTGDWHTRITFGWSHHWTQRKCLRVSLPVIGGLGFKNSAQENILWFNWTTKIVHYGFKYKIYKNNINWLTLRWVEEQAIIHWVLNCVSAGPWSLSYKINKLC